MNPPDRPEWPLPRILLWVAVLAVAAVWKGPQIASLFRPPPQALTDFSQEWLSAKNYFAGMPVYLDQTESIRRHLGTAPERVEDTLARNAHPPASILLALPLHSLAYSDAHLVWNAATFGLFLLAIALVVRELGMPFQLLSLLPLTALLLLCQPVAFQLIQGQLNFLLAFLLTAAWAADRRGYRFGAGAALGAAAAIKLFPAFLFLYLLFTRRWVALATGAVVFLSLNGIAVALFGVVAFETYAREVVPSVASIYQTNWRNVSLTGFWLRLFAPGEAARVAPLVDLPIVGQVAANALRGAIVLALAVACWRADTPARRDRAFAACIVGVLLVSPLTWPHYFLLLLLPLCLVWMRLRSVGARCALWAIVVVMWLPQEFLAAFVVGVPEMRAMTVNRHGLLGADRVLAITAPLHLALVSLFLLTLLSPAGGDRPAEEPVPGPGPGSEPDERLNRRLFGSIGAPGAT